MCVCACVWEGKGECERRLIKAGMGKGGGAGVERVHVSECVGGVHDHYAYFPVLLFRAIRIIHSFWCSFGSDKFLSPMLPIFQQ